MSSSGVSLAGAVLLNPTTGQVIQNAATGPLVIKANAGGGNMLEVRDSNNNPVWVLNSSGNQFVGATDDLYHGVDGAGRGGLRTDSSFMSGGPVIPNSAAGIFSGTGVPGVGTGNNGDFYLRQDGGAGTSIYMKRAGAWVGIV